jgi:hypothetical protein
MLHNICVHRNEVLIRGIRALRSEEFPVDKSVEDATAARKGRTQNDTLEQDCLKIFEKAMYFICSVL